MRLQQLEDAGEGRVAAEGAAEDDDDAAVAGARQRDLLEWYFKYLVEK